MGQHVPWRSWGREPTSNWKAKATSETPARLPSRDFSQTVSTAALILPLHQPTAENSSALAASCDTITQLVFVVVIHTFLMR
jgi:hypothetical protein